MFVKLRKPAIFQGRHRKHRYFEGWYNKIVSRKGDVFAVIFGVALGTDRSDRNSFIQVIEGKTGEAFYLRFPYEDFFAARNHYEIRIGPSTINCETIHLDIGRDDRSVKADLRLSGAIPLKSRFFSPGIMGWYSYVPFMECKHGVVSLHHRVDGRFELDGNRITFENGNGYAEKDWGRSFPTAWIWAQSNNFETPTASCMFSVARIPWLGRWFIGFLFVLHTGERQYRLATYTGAKITRLDVHGKNVFITIEDRNHSVEISALRSTTGVLQAPVNGVMERRISESIDAVIDVTLRDLPGTELWRGSGKFAGLEIVGDYNVLQTGLSIPDQALNSDKL